jgi:hypothetical protein
MSKPKCLVFVALMCMFASSSVVAAFARAPAGEAMAAPAPRPTPLAYPQLEADFSIYNWHKSETPRDLIGTMTVYPSGGDGHYTYEFIGVRYTNTFDFRWRACTTLVNSLRVWSGDGQRIDVPVWRDDLPCPKKWRGEEN